MAIAATVAFVASGCSGGSGSSGGAGHTGSTGSTSAAYPAAPPARICGNASVLDGPSSAPVGAMVIDTATNLYDATLAQPPGTTFWLTAGVHTLGTGEFGQVVPKDRDTYIGAPGAILDGQHLNRYAFTQQAVGVTVEDLTVRNFGAAGGNHDEGVVNHDSGVGWTIKGLTVENSAGAGVFVGSHDLVEDNCLKDDGQYGFSAFSANGVTDITITHNEITGNDADNWEQRIPQCGCSGGGKFWNVRGAKVTDNWVHDNPGVGLWADTDDVAFDIEGNYIEGNADEAIIYEISYNALIKDNTIVRNALVEGRQYAARGDDFPIPAIYISESGGDSRVDPRYPVLQITGNNFVDNWGGVTLWENADRFCGSPNNTSATFCTLGSGASLTACVQGKIGQPPLYSDCRWHTQNVSVSGNWFALDKSAIDCQRFCGVQGILSNFGTSPTWSPYKGKVIEQAITFDQDDHFSDNHYVGDWQFMTKDTDGLINFAQWQAAPYHQDAGSSLSS